MALVKDMKIWQIKDFLENELKEQIFLEIAPILYIGQTTGGYFGVTRHILCLVDFLGALYCGYMDEEKKEDFKRYKKMIISKSSKVEKFIREFLGDEEIDSNYKKNGNIFYKMYRHGLVHLYQPKTLKQKNGREVIWAIYKGPRQRATIQFKADKGEYIINNVRHLDIVSNPALSNSDILTISITCLYKDLLTVIDKFNLAIEKDASLVKNWQSASNAIIEAEEIEYENK
ncbi:hypothetical protein A3D76_04795 [Candidatus Roizmanbacteria bacterium RIFCSPHIGHO2_02_FULL_37_9b]|nr:MAG: hypothetical protein A3D76_04795 [Candidatus Roizmanbacteria bacterium RIFCSPHIGHO2_02_FULL_37_9b]